MHNSNSFIMRDQVSDVVRSVMGDDRKEASIRYLSHASLIIFSILIFSI
jgi:hypothetical protein